MFAICKRTSDTKTIYLILLLAVAAAPGDYPLEDRIPASLHSALHFVIPAAVCAAVALLPIKHSAEAGFLAGVSVATAKEIFDAVKGYDFSFSDLGYGVAGSLVGFCIVISF